MPLINDDRPNDRFIELVSCYAYQRKKYLNRRLRCLRCQFQALAIFWQVLPAQCHLECRPSLVVLVRRHHDPIYSIHYSPN